MAEGEGKGLDKALLLKHSTATHPPGGGQVLLGELKKKNPPHRRPSSEVLERKKDKQKYAKKTEQAREGKGRISNPTKIGNNKKKERQRK